MSEINEDDPLAMANLPLHLTGLPMVVWAPRAWGCPTEERIYTDELLRRLQRLRQR